MTHVGVGGGGRLSLRHNTNSLCNLVNYVSGGKVILHFDLNLNEKFV